jgi:hypothetical protein
MVGSAAIRTIPLVFLIPLLGLAQQAIAKQPPSPSSKTLFVVCDGTDGPQHVLSPVSVSEDGRWKAYVEVDVRSGTGCMHTTRLWISEAAGPNRIVYLMAPKRIAVGNGMEILGWAKGSRMLLVKTEEWQQGSDAADTQQVLAIDAGTGMVYEPALDAMLQPRKGKQCSFRVDHAGFSAGKNINILVRAHFYTLMDVDQTGADMPASERCEHVEETWSFNFATGEIAKVANSHPFQLFNQSPAN